MKIPSQPSPTNLSDELDKILNGLEADAIEASIIDDIPILSEYDPVHIKAKAAITAAYAEAINEVIGEELDYEKYGKCPSCGAAYMYQCTCDQGSLYTINQQRQRLQGLLPTNASDGTKG